MNYNSSFPNGWVNGGGAGGPVPRSMIPTFPSEAQVPPQAYGPFVYFSAAHNHQPHFQLNQNNSMPPFSGAQQSSLSQVPKCTNEYAKFLKTSFSATVSIRGQFVVVSKTYFPQQKDIKMWKLHARDEHGITDPKSQTVWAMRSKDFLREIEIAWITRKVSLLCQQLNSKGYHYHGKPIGNLENIQELLKMKPVHLQFVQDLEKLLHRNGLGDNDQLEKELLMARGLVYDTPPETKNNKKKRPNKSGKQGFLRALGRRIEQSIIITPLQDIAQGTHTMKLVIKEKGSQQLSHCAKKRTAPTGVVGGESGSTGVSSAGNLQPASAGTVDISSSCRKVCVAEGDCQFPVLFL